MKQLFAVYTAELLKLKRTIAFLLAIIIPVLFATLTIFMVLDRGLESYNEEMYFSLLNFSFSLWPIIVVPMLLSIEVGLISSTETTTGQWKHIFCLPVPKWKILFAKWLVMITVTFGIHALFVLLFMGNFPFLQLFAPQVSIVPYMNVQEFAMLFAILCVSSLGLSTIHFIFSLLFPGLVGNIGLGIGAVTLALGFTWVGQLLQYFPWTTPLAALGNFIELHTHFSPATAILVSLFTAIIWLIPGIVSFSRKDIL